MSAKLHGTTRDFLEHELTLKDISLTLYDTAGIREIMEDSTDNSINSTFYNETNTSIHTIEQEGIQRSRDLLIHAHVIIYVYDGNEGWTTYDTNLLEQLGYSTTNTIQAENSCYYCSK